MQVVLAIHLRRRLAIEHTVRIERINRVGRRAFKQRWSLIGWCRLLFLFDANVDMTKIWRSVVCGNVRFTVRWIQENHMVYSPAQVKQQKVRLCSVS
jgi:hypothetical protein